MATKPKTQEGPRVTMASLKTKWTGIRPVVMHNGLLVDRTYDYVPKIKAITGKKKKTDEDYAELERLEFLGGLYWDDEVGLHVPPDNLERCIQLGAQRSKNGKEVQSCVFVQEELPKLVYDGPQTREGLLADPRYSLRKGVCIKKNRVIRVRPMIPPGWSITFTVDYDSSVISRDNLLLAMTNAGMFIGLGDWRPKFGRFLVEELA